MKRHERLMPLSREHHTALVLAKRLSRPQGDADARQALCEELVRRFAAELDPHFREEEVVFLPQLASNHSAALHRTLDEHRRLRELAEEIGQGKAEALASFGKLLADHVRFEERELFPLIEASFPPDP